MNLNVSYINEFVIIFLFKLFYLKAQHDMNASIFRLITLISSQNLLESGFLLRF